MVKTTLLSALPLLMLAEQALGFGCATHSYTTCEDKIVHWFDPDDGMICDPLDCGGGRAPVKTGVPGCANYSGTESYGGTSYLSCWKPSTTLRTGFAQATSEVASADAEPTSTVVEVETQTTTKSHAAQETSTSTALIEATISEQTTIAPVLPTQTQTTGETETTAKPASTPSVIPNAAQAMKGSLIAAAGVAMGAILLL